VVEDQSQPAADASSDGDGRRAPRRVFRPEAWIGLLGVLVGGVMAFAGTWWLQHSDVNAELRGTARVLAFDLADRAGAVEALGGVGVRRTLKTGEVRWCVRAGGEPAVLSSAAWRRRCARFSPQFDFGARLSSVLRPDARGLSWSEADRKLLASRLSADEWSDLIYAVTQWEAFRDSAEWFTASGRFKTKLADQWFDKFGLYRRGGRRALRRFQLAAQRAILALELGRRALSRHEG
jgi:hypothetical protein